MSISRAASPRAATSGCLEFLSPDLRVITTRRLDRPVANSSIQKLFREPVTTQPLVDLEKRCFDAEGCSQRSVDRANQLYDDDGLAQEPQTTHSSPHFSTQPTTVAQHQFFFPTGTAPSEFDSRHQRRGGRGWPGTIFPKIQRVKIGRAHV